MVSGVRVANSEDSVTCATIFNKWVDATPWMPRVHDRADVDRFYREVVFAEDEVLVSGNPVAGFLALETSCVRALYCDKTGQGHGRALLNDAKTRRDHLWLYTFAANEGAQRFYEREGFVETARSDGDNEEGLPDIRYDWHREAAA